MRTLALGLLALFAFGCSRSSELASNPDADRVPASTAPKGEILTAPAQAPAAVAGASGGKTGEAQSDRCPGGMVLVEGLYCPNPKQECIDWIDDPVKFPYARCAKYSSKVECSGKRVPMTYCIDRNEHAAKGEELPTGDISWTDAKNTCEGMGKRLCGESEWVFACEGEASVPYPYGYERDSSKCNFEKQDLVEKGKLRDLREPVESNPECLSPFGVHNMVGNIDEWVVLDKPHYSKRNDNRKMVSGLKGGWWGPLRNRCRPTTVDHDEHFHELQTGFRCCADVKTKVASIDEDGR
jgi:formylglycine-generating enzyme